MSEISASLDRHQHVLRACEKCPNMIGPVVVGQPVSSPVYLIGQAPGAKEGGCRKTLCVDSG